MSHESATESRPSIIYNGLNHEIRVSKYICGMLYCIIDTISYLIKHIDYNIRLILMVFLSVILRCVVLTHSRDTCTVDNVTVRGRHVLTTLLQL